MATTKPDIERLLTVLRGGKADRVPNFEIVINSRNLRALLGHEPSGESLWGVTAEEAVAAALAVGQDAIPCTVKFGLEQGSICEPADLAGLEMPDMTSRRDKLKSFLAATEGTGLGVCPCLSGPFTASCMASGPIPIQSFLMMIYTQPDVVEGLLDFYTAYTIAAIRAIADLPFHFFYIGDDVTGFVSPEHLDRLWAQRHKKIIDAARETGRPILAHCCGPQAEVLPYFKRWGVDAVHPLQPDVNDIYAVRAQYPEIALVGNISVQEVLSFGTPEEVAADTLEHLEKLAPQGGYVVGSSHSIIDSIPPANYRAMLETAWQYAA